MIVEQRRLEQMRAAQAEASVARQRVHALLHTAEQALAAGQLSAARAAADELKALKGAAGILPKPTVQRQSRLAQQLTELERWESFGQHNARLQLCERAEAAAAGGLDAPKLALEVRKLREEWKALDQQHAGVPKSMWERFDAACTKAYAPAARHFAELAAATQAGDEAARGFHRCRLRARRDAHGRAARLACGRALAARDRRQVARGRSRQRGARRMEEARCAAQGRRRSAARCAGGGARGGEGGARGADRGSRGACGQGDGARCALAGKAIQARWQEQAKAMPLAQRDERGLWEQFRAACDAVFEARHSKRKEEDVQKHESRRALDDICLHLEQLAQAADKDDSEIKRGCAICRSNGRATAASEPAGAASSRASEREDRGGGRAVGARSRPRIGRLARPGGEGTLCEELDLLLLSGEGSADAAAAHAQWTALAVLPAAWEKGMIGRRDAALRALGDEAAAVAHVMRDRTLRRIAPRNVARAGAAARSRMPAGASGAATRAAAQTAARSFSGRCAHRRQ